MIVDYITWIIWFILSWRSDYLHSLAPLHEKHVFGINKVWRTSFLVWNHKILWEDQIINGAQRIIMATAYIHLKLCRSSLMHVHWHSCYPFTQLSVPFCLFTLGQWSPIQSCHVLRLCPMLTGASHRTALSQTSRKKTLQLQWKPAKHPTLKWMLFDSR